MTAKKKIATFHFYTPGNTIEVQSKFHCAIKAVHKRTWVENQYGSRKKRKEIEFGTVEKNFLQLKSATAMMLEVFWGYEWVLSILLFPLHPT